jgi:hypothetical protein
MTDLFEVVKRVFPKGLAFRFFIGSQYREFTEGISIEPGRIAEFFQKVLESGVPGYIPEEALDDWEFFLNLDKNDSLTIEERNDRIVGKISAQGGQGPGYIQNVLQDAGYPVYVTENVPQVDPTTKTGWLIPGPPTYSIQSLYAASYGGCTYGSRTYGQKQFSDIVEDTVTIPVIPNRYIFIWFITGPAGIDDFVDLPIISRDDIRKQILQIKPAHTWVIAQINFKSLGELWTLRTSGTTNKLTDIIYSGDQYVIAGDADTILISTDGSIWTLESTGIGQPLLGITYGNNQYITVGNNGTIATSPDAITWTNRTSGTIQILAEITYGSNQYVTVGASGTILTSPFGINWTSRTSGTGNFLNGIIYGNNQYITVGNTGTILTSPDAITWTSRTSGTAQALADITYGNNLYVAVGLGGTILTSPDGITWTLRTSGTTQLLNGVTYGNNLYVAVGNTGTILTSLDAITWTSQTSGTSNRLESIAFKNNQFVAVGNTGTIVASF